MYYKLQNLLFTGKVVESECILIKINIIKWFHYYKWKRFSTSSYKSLKKIEKERKTTRFRRLRNRWMGNVEDISQMNGKQREIFHVTNKRTNGKNTRHWIPTATHISRIQKINIRLRNTIQQYNLSIFLELVENQKSQKY